MHAVRIVLATAAAAAAVALPFVGARASEEMAVASMKFTAARGEPYRAGELIVQFHRSVDDQRAERAMRFAGGREAQRSRFGNRFLVQLAPGEHMGEVLARLRSMPDVDYAEPNGTVSAFQATHFRPNDRRFGLQWHMRMVDAERTWAIQKGDPSVAVAVLDTGIAYEDFGPYRKAPDFGGTTFLQGFDFVNNDDHANDDNAHGTHVASTVAEATNNDTGVAGLAFGCALMPVKVLARDGRGDFFRVADGIDYAINFTVGGNKPVKVINLSLGGEQSSITAERAIDRAVNAGVTVVAASGNDEEGELNFPARYSQTIAVGAVDGRKRRAPYSNFGAGLDVVAPGGDLDRDETGENDRPDGFADGVVQQTFNPVLARDQGRFDDFALWFFQGTSMATPHVSAMACLLYRQGITSPAAVRAAIETTAEDLGAPGRDNTFGWGLIRPSVALSGLGLNQ